MRIAKTVIIAALLSAALMGNSALAQTNTSTTSAGSSGSTTPPVVVAGKGKVAIPTDLQGLVKKFEAERSAYLDLQKALEAKLKNASTPEERAAVRQTLQENRDVFLSDLKEFRQDLKQELVELKNKLNNTELDRLIEEVQHEVDTHNHHGKT
jgi:hypothetical protein